MDPTSHRSPHSAVVPPATASPAKGLAIASLALGIVGLLSSLLLVGGLLALVGLILGAVHLRRSTHARAMAWTGVGLSTAAMVVAAVILSIVVSAARWNAEASRGFSRNPFAAWYGKPAPDFEVTTLDGDTVRLADLAGKRVVIDFWASWLPSCVRRVPFFKQLQQDFPADDLVIVAISGEDSDVLRTFVGDQGIDYSVACSARGVLPKPYCDVRTLPTTFFVDRNGIIEHVSVGNRDYDSLRRHASGSTTNGPAGRR